MTKGGSYCAVAECNNSSVKAHKNNLILTFHRFPKDERKKEWLNRCKRMDKINLDRSNNYYVCSAHFDEEDYEPDLRAKLMNEPRKRRLKSTAIPHLNLPSSTSALVTKLGNNNSARHTRMKKKQIKQNISEVLKNTTAPIESMLVVGEVNELDEEMAAVDAVVENETSKENSASSIDEIIKKQQDEINELKSTVASMKTQLDKYSGSKFARIHRFFENRGLTLAFEPRSQVQSGPQQPQSVECASANASVTTTAALRSATHHSPFHKFAIRIPIGGAQKLWLLGAGDRRAVQSIRGSHLSRLFRSLFRLPPLDVRFSLRVRVFYAPYRKHFAVVDHFSHRTPPLCTLLVHRHIEVKCRTNGRVPDAICRTPYAVDPPTIRSEAEGAANRRLAVQEPNPAANTYFCHVRRS
ncbi:hypothetical protein V9T40_009557 [Parthenolecanium corni]|uniref:THAP-type domain-containing protein n=1 Tax=Parthenolecanium corni TaxID=536013 RepID=A0AAN9TSJ8_9HEMI